MPRRSYANASCLAVWTASASHPNQRICRPGRFPPESLVCNLVTNPQAPWTLVIPGAGHSFWAQHVAADADSACQGRSILEASVLRSGISCCMPCTTSAAVFREQLLPGFCQLSATCRRRRSWIIAGWRAVVWWSSRGLIFTSSAPRSSRWSGPLRNLAHF